MIPRHNLSQKRETAKGLPTAVRYLTILLVCSLSSSFAQDRDRRKEPSVPFERFSVGVRMGFTMTSTIKTGNGERQFENFDDFTGALESVTTLKRASGEGLGYIIHFTCGIHPAARYTGNCFLEDQRVPGYNAVGLGLPFWMPGGGENHPDAVLSKQSLWLDGDQIVKDGLIVGPPDLAELAQDLKPLYR